MWGRGDTDIQPMASPDDNWLEGQSGQIKGVSNVEYFLGKMSSYKNRS